MAEAQRFALINAFSLADTATNCNGPIWGRTCHPRPMPFSVYANRHVGRDGPGLLHRLVYGSVNRGHEGLDDLPAPYQCHAFPAHQPLPVFRIAGPEPDFVTGLYLRFKVLPLTVAEAERNAAVEVFRLPFGNCGLSTEQLLEHR